MIDLGSTSFYLGAPVMSREDFEAYSTRLFEEWDTRLAGELNLSDYSLTLELEEGSVEGLGTVGVVIGVLLAGISNYGGLVTGLEAIGKQVRSAGDYLADRAAAPFVMLNLKPRVRRRSGKLGQLQRLFVRVQRRDISAEEALREAEDFLADDATESPDFMELLGSTLRGIPRNPEQLALPMRLPEDAIPEGEASADLGARARKRPLALPPKQQWRVEVWRESRTGKRHIRITEV